MNRSGPRRWSGGSGWPIRLDRFARLVVVVITFCCARAVAQTEAPRDPRRVLLLADSPGDPFMARIRAEIASLGLDVVVRAPQGSIETSARAERAVAAIRVLPSRKGVEVWMADATSGRSLLRQAIVDEAPGGPNQNVVALQTAELLRTSLFPHPPPEAAKPAPPPTPSASVQVPPPPSGESGLGGSVGLLYGGSDATSAWQAWLSYLYIGSRGLGAGLTVGAPLQRGTMSGPEGTSEVGAITGGVEGLARFKFQRERLVLTTGLGASLVGVLAKGHPATAAGPQLVGNASTAYTGLGYARVAAAWKISDWLGLGVSALAGRTTAPVRIRFAGNDAGDWGTVVLGTTFFCQADWR